MTESLDFVLITIMCATARKICKSYLIFWEILIGEYGQAHTHRRTQICLGTSQIKLEKVPCMQFSTVEG